MRYAAQSSGGAELFQWLKKVIVIVNAFRGFNKLPVFAPLEWADRRSRRILLSFG
jgi:hypothetical protein